MFIVTPTLEARPSSFRSGTEWHFASHSPPAVGPSARRHAAPLELGRPGGICGYKHGAPKGAFCLVAVTSLPCETCVLGASLAALRACERAWHLGRRSGWGENYCTRSCSELNRLCISLTTGIARAKAFCSVCPANDFMITRTAATESPLRSRSGITTLAKSFSFP